MSALASRRLRAVSLLVALALLCAACGAGPADATATSQAAGLSEQALRGGTYDLPDVGQVTLTDGVFASQTGQGASETTRVDFASAATGDLDGDGVADAAVVLVAQTGGSGSFYYLVALLGDTGSPQQAAVTLLGDRIELQQLTIVNAGIVLVALMSGPDDPLCCPSQQTTSTYRLAGGALTLLEQVVVTATPAS
jgi:hypothetical protein